MKVVKKTVLGLYHYFEQIMIISLLIMLMVVVGAAVYRMGYVLVHSFLDDGVHIFITLEAMHKIFGAFLIILIGIELLETIKMYLKDDVIHVEVVFLVAMIGVARHVIDLDYHHIEPLTLIGIASIIIALTVGYYFLKRANVELVDTKRHKKKKEEE